MMAPVHACRATAAGVSAAGRTSLPHPGISAPPIAAVATGEPISTILPSNARPATQSGSSSGLLSVHLSGVSISTLHSS